jgi:hypothetical protein
VNKCAKVCSVGEIKYSSKASTRSGYISNTNFNTYFIYMKK